MSLIVVTIAKEGCHQPVKEWFGIRIENDVNLAELYTDFASGKFDDTPVNEEDRRSFVKVFAGMMETMDSANLSVGFIGAGKMALALATGMIRSGVVNSGRIWASAPSDRNIVKFKVAGAHVTKRNIDVVKHCKVVFIATKPAVVQSVLQEISQHVTADHLIVSVAAGIKIPSLEKDLLHQSRVIRMMPNTACSVQKGATVFSLGMWCKQEDALLLQKLLTPCGFVAEVPESCIDVHTGMSGSGVAYGLVFAEALADGAVKMGMTRDLANKIAAQTLIGAGMLLLESGQHVGLLKDNVVSPGGTTSHGLHQLEKGCFRATVINAVEAATVRSQFLSNQ